MTDEVARVVTAPRIKNVGGWCAFAAVVLWVFRDGPWTFLGTLPGAGWWRTAFLLVLFGLVVRAGHDALMWLFEAHNALQEKRRFEAMGVPAAIKWAQEKEINDAIHGNVKADPKLVAEMERLLLEKHPIR